MLNFLIIFKWGVHPQYDLREIFDQNNVILCYTNGFKR